MTIRVDDLPWNQTGRYKLTVPGDLTEAFRGARFVRGVTVDPVDGITARRLYQAFGERMTIEDWESSTPVAASSPKATPSDEGEDDGNAPLFVADNDDDLEAMNRHELRDYALKLGLQPHWKAGAAKLKAMIRDKEDRS